jgi:hypothetical protein
VRKDPKARIVMANEAVDEGSFYLVGIGFFPSRRVLSIDNGFPQALLFILDSPCGKPAV